MLQRLQKKWKVSGRQLFTILLIFSLGGSLTGFAVKKFIAVFEIEFFFLKTVVYILLLTLIWPLAILIVSLPLGQFPFFKKYIARIGNRLFIRKK